MVMNFAELIDPITPEVFFDEYYGQKPLHIPGDPEKFADLMSWSDLNQILAINAFWTADSLKLYQDIAAVPVGDYCRSVPGLGARGDAARPGLGEGSVVTRRGARAEFHRYADP